MNGLSSTEKKDGTRKEISAGTGREIVAEARSGNRTAFERLVMLGGPERESWIKEISGYPAGDSDAQEARRKIIMIVRKMETDGDLQFYRIGEVPEEGTYITV